MSCHQVTCLCDVVEAAKGGVCNGALVMQASTVIPGREWSLPREE